MNDASSHQKSCCRVTEVLIRMLPELHSQLHSCTSTTQNRHVNSLYQCYSCISAGLKGLLSLVCTELYYSPDSVLCSSTQPKSHGDIGDSLLSLGLRDIVDDYSGTFWGPVMWPTSFRLVVGGDRSLELECVLKTLDLLASTCFSTEEIFCDFTTVITSYDAATFNGVNDYDSRNPFLVEIMLHLIYQCLLWRGDHIRRESKALQKLTPSLLSLIGSPFFPEKTMAENFIIECVSRCVSLSCVLFSGKENELYTLTKPIIDVDFLHSTSRSLFHKTMSSKASFSCIHGSIRTAEAILEVLMCVIPENDGASIQSTAENGYCFDITVNAIDCLEKYAGLSSSEPWKGQHAIFNSQLIPSRSLIDKNCASPEEKVDVNEVVIAILHLLGTEVMRGAFGGSIEGRDYNTAVTSRILKENMQTRLRDTLISLLRRVKVNNKSNEATITDSALEDRVYSSVLDVMGRFIWMHRSTLGVGEYFCWNCEKYITLLPRMT